jgi:hypothetical protein|tara:strand:- start:552 stop:896 length:345 start_codon:yes stop_codon:yes gene_type:complete
MPYSFMRFNCWDFVVKVRKDNGLRCETFRPKKLRDAFALISSHLESDHLGFEKVETLKNFDIILCDKKLGKLSIFHCGIYFDGMIYHCDRGRGQVTLDKLDAFTKQFESVTFWR